VANPGTRPRVRIHTNMAGAVPADAWLTLVRNVFGAGGPPPSGLSEEEGRSFEQLKFFFTTGVGYGVQRGTKPQTLYGLADSPVTLAAWMINHDASSYADIAAAFAGHPVGNLTRDEVLDTTSPPGRSRRCSPPSCAPRSGPCGRRSSAPPRRASSSGVILGPRVRG